jgi:hypothetical protein
LGCCYCCCCCFCASSPVGVEEEDDVQINVTDRSDNDAPETLDKTLDLDSSEILF